MSRKDVVLVYIKAKNKRSTWRVTAEVYPVVYPRCSECKANIGRKCGRLCLKLELMNGMSDFVRTYCGIARFQGFTLTPQKIKNIHRKS